MLINNTNNNQQNEPPKSSRFNSDMTLNSAESIPEINNKSRLWFKIFYFVFTLISLVVGVMIIYKKNFYFNSEYKFSYSLLVLIFVLIYTLGFLTALIASLIITIVIMIFKSIFSCCRKKDKNLDNEDNLSFITCSLVILEIMLIILYLAVIPYSIVLFVKMFKHHMMKNYHKFYLLYLFILVNGFMGVVFVLIGIYTFFFTHVKTSTRNKYVVYDEDIANVEKEVKEAYIEYVCKGKELDNINS